MLIKKCQNFLRVVFWAEGTNHTVEVDNQKQVIS